MVVLGRRLDSMILEVFSNLWFYDSTILHASPDSRYKSNSTCSLWVGQSGTRLRAPSASALNWGSTEAEEFRHPVLRRWEELMPIVPPGTSPQLGLQIMWGLLGCVIAGITTGTDITELVIHHVWHQGYFRKYCFGTFRNNYIKAGAMHCFRRRSCRQ